MKPFELKIKAKMLAYEAQTLRKEERHLRNVFRSLVAENKRRVKNGGNDLLDTSGLSALADARHGLYAYRTGNVRNDARATNLARAYLAGHTRASVEKTMNHMSEAQETALQSSVATMVRKHGSAMETTLLSAWMQG